ncbi:MAG: AMP-binding protein [Bacilli bacterium]|nr:AMP-binding protein [Bacilli bacterium]
MKNLTVYNNLESGLASDGSHLILDVGGDEVTSGELLENVDNISKALDMLSVGVDKPITVLDDTTEAFINLFYGSNKYGSIFATPGFPLFADNPQEFTDELESDTIFISKRFYEALENNPSTKGAISKTGIKNIVLLPTEIASYNNLQYNESIDDILTKGFKLYPNIEYIDYTDLMKSAENDKRKIKINNDGGSKDCSYLFTSGSTGKPKTLRMPNSAFVNMCRKLEAQGYDFIPDEDKYLATLPCNFVTPLETLNFFLQLGVPAYIDPLIDFSKIAEIYYKSGATIIMSPPSILDPLYIMITKSKRKKISFILETIKNAPKSVEPTKEEKIQRIKTIKKMFEKRPDVKYVFSAGEPLTKRLESSYKNDNIEILNCTGSGETGPTAINGKPLLGDVYRVLDPITLEVIYSSDKPNLDITVRGLIENKKSSSSFNGYLNNQALTDASYNVSEDNIEFWKYFDIVEVKNGIMKTLCRADDSIITNDNIITPNDLNTVILEDNRILKCEAYPAFIDGQNRMVVDIVIRERDRNKFYDIINKAHNNIKNQLGEEYLPFVYKDNKDFGAKPYSAKLDRDAIRKNNRGYVSPNQPGEITIPENYNSIQKLLKTYK